MRCRSSSTARVGAHRPSRAWGGCGELPAARLRSGAGWTRHGGRTEGIPSSAHRSGSPAGMPQPGEGRLAVDVAIRFVEALDADAGADPDLLAERLAHAAAAALPVRGGGLSLHGEAGRGAPPAASSEGAATAERLQFTAGSGPCLLAAESGLPVFANEEILGRRWPVFHDLLVTHTLLRSVLALSLSGRLQAVGGMDLYFADPDGVTAVDVYEARCVARLVSDHLDVAADWSVWTPTALPAWSDTPDAQRRGRLWMPSACSCSPSRRRLPTRWRCCAATPTRPVGRPTTSPSTWSRGRLRPDLLREDAGSDN